MTHNLYSTMICNRCGIYNRHEMDILLNAIKDAPKNPTARIEYAWNAAVEMFSSTINSYVANASVYIAKTAKDMANDEKFVSYCRKHKVTSKAAQRLFAYIVLFYGDGCDYSDAVLDMTDTEIDKLCEDPSVYHFVKNIFKHSAPNWVCREFIRVLLSHLPKEKRTKDSLAYIVRYGIIH